MPSAEMMPARRPCASDRAATYVMSGPGAKLSASDASTNEVNDTTAASVSRYHADHAQQGVHPLGGRRADRLGVWRRVIAARGLDPGIAGTTGAVRSRGSDNRRPAAPHDGRARNRTFARR